MKSFIIIGIKKKQHDLRPILHSSPDHTHYIPERYQLQKLQKNYVKNILFSFFRFFFPLDFAMKKKSKIILTRLRIVAGSHAQPAW